MHGSRVRAVRGSFQSSDLRESATGAGGIHLAGRSSSSRATFRAGTAAAPAPSFSADDRFLPRRGAPRYDSGFRSVTEPRRIQRENGAPGEDPNSTDSIERPDRSPPPFPPPRSLDQIRCPWRSGRSRQRHALRWRRVDRVVRGTPADFLWPEPVPRPCLPAEESLPIGPRESLPSNPCHRWSHERSLALDLDHSRSLRQRESIIGVQR